MSVASPCIDVCRIDEATGYCVGCQRTMEEIGRWRDMTDGQRLAVLNRLERRRAGADATARAG